MEHNIRQQMKLNEDETSRRDRVPRLGREDYIAILKTKGHIQAAQDAQPQKKTTALPDTSPHAERGRKA